MNNYEVNGLPNWIYTHQVYVQAWAPWNYLERNSNVDTITALQRTKALWILPFVNNYWLPVEESTRIWEIKATEMIWYLKLKINHVLANKSWSADDLTEIQAHPQAIMQCAKWLSNIWANPDKVFEDTYKTPEIYSTKELLIEIDDWVGNLAKILEFLSKSNINLEYINSIPYWNSKYRFSLLLTEEENLNSKISSSDFVKCDYLIYEEKL